VSGPGAMAATAFTASEEGWLLAYQWAGALAAGTPLPQQETPVPLGPGEVAHAGLQQVGITAFYGESTGYRPSFFLLGGPVGLAVTGAASLAHNASKKAEAQRAAQPRWQALGRADVVLTNQRLVLTAGDQPASLWHAECGPLQPIVARDAVPAVQLQASGHPPMRLTSPYIPLLFVFTQQVRDGRPPALPMPDGLIERARAAGRLP
jgi:hypothetical protein